MDLWLSAAEVAAVNGVFHLCDLLKDVLQTSKLLVITWEYKLQYIKYINIDISENKPTVDSHWADCAYVVKFTFKSN